MAERPGFGGWCAQPELNQAIRLSLGYINNYATIIAHWLARFPLVPRWIVCQQGNFLVRG
jgi:hypothetical protein